MKVFAKVNITEIFFQKKKTCESIVMIKKIKPAFKIVEKGISIT